MDDLKIFLPFEKKNSDEMTVEGYASTEDLDSQGEIVKVSAIQKALPDYMKYGNIREMHQWSAVGKTVSAKVDEDKKGLLIKGLIVDKNAWEKVKAGVYNGFSIGGKVVRKIGNIIEELVLNEISIVDRPANPSAVFSLVKINNGKVVEKQSPVAPHGMDETEAEEAPENLNVFIADSLIRMATEVAFMIMRNKNMERKTEHLENLLMGLKNAASFELKLKKSEDKTEEKAEEKSIVDRLKEAKDKLEQAVYSKPIKHDWSEGYFEQMREVL